MTVLPFAALEWSTRKQKNCNFSPKVPVKTTRRLIYSYQWFKWIKLFLGDWKAAYYTINKFSFPTGTMVNEP